MSIRRILGQEALTTPKPQIKRKVATPPLNCSFNPPIYDFDKYCNEYKKPENIKKIDNLIADSDFAVLYCEDILMNRGTVERAINGIIIENTEIKKLPAGENQQPRVAFIGLPCTEAAIGGKGFVETGGLYIFRALKEMTTEINTLRSSLTTLNENQQQRLNILQAEVNKISAKILFISDNKMPEADVYTLGLDFILNSLRTTYGFTGKAMLYSADYDSNHEDVKPLLSAHPNNHVVKKPDTSLIKTIQAILGEKYKVSPKIVVRKKKMELSRALSLPLSVNPSSSEAKTTASSSFSNSRSSQEISLSLSPLSIYTSSSSSTLFSPSSSFDKSPLDPVTLPGMLSSPGAPETPLVTSSGSDLGIGGSFNQTMGQTGSDLQTGMSPGVTKRSGLG